MVESGTRSRRSREDWTAAALEALAEGGLAAVAVEPLAARLGVTKGSGYWHFAGREELLRAALERWEAEDTEAVIEQVEAWPGPRERLRVLFGAALSDSRGSGVQAALLACPDHPVVAPILRRVTERRIGYLTSLYSALGLGGPAARRRAMLAYATYLGTVQLRRALPARPPISAASKRAYLADALAALTTTSTRTP